MSGERTPFHRLLSLLQHKLFLSLWISGFIFSSVVLVQHIAPEYTATATILLEARPRGRNLSQAADDNSVNSALDSLQAESQIQVLKSGRVLSKVFDELQSTIEASSKISQEKPTIFRHIGDAIFSSRQISLDERTRRQIRYNRFADNVSARRAGQSYVIELTFRSFDPVLAARVANAIVLQYIKEQIDAKSADVGSGSEYLQGRTASIKSQQDSLAAGIKKGEIPDDFFPDAAAKIITPATPPLAKSYPKGSLIISFASIIGLLSGSIVALLYDILIGKIYYDEQVRDRTQIPYLGTIRRRNSGMQIKERISLGAADLKLDFKMDKDFFMRCKNAQVTFSRYRSAQAGKSAGFIAPKPGQYVSFMVSCFGLLLKNAGNDVAVVEANCQAPGLELVDSLLKLKYEQCQSIRLTEVEGAAGKDVADNSLKFVNANQEWYEICKVSDSRGLKIILDNATSGAIVLCSLPPISTSVDAVEISRLVDVIVIVVDRDRDSLRDVVSLARELSESGATCLGYVMF